MISSSRDAAVHKLGERLFQTKIVSKSVTGRPVPVIQTECEVQIDRVNIGIVNGPTDPSVTPLRVIQVYTVWVNSGRT